MRIKLNFKQLVAIHLILILILIGLTIKILEQRKDYSCDKCIIVFREWNYMNDAGGEIVIEAPLQKLYEGYMNGKCPVEWTKDQAYSINENFNVTFVGGGE